SSYSTAYRDSPPFPTRRSSDLGSPGSSLFIAHIQHERAPSPPLRVVEPGALERPAAEPCGLDVLVGGRGAARRDGERPAGSGRVDRKSTRLNSSHSQISYAVFC